MSPVIHLVLQVIIGPEHGLVDISTRMTLDFSYFGRKRPLSNFSCRNQTGITLCLTLGVTILASTKDIKLVLSSHFTVGAPVWIDKASMYLRITLFFLTALYMHTIYPSVESDAIAGWICTLHQTATPSRV